MMCKDRQSIIFSVEHVEKTNSANLEKICLYCGSTPKDSRIPGFQGTFREATQLAVSSVELKKYDGIISCSVNFLFMADMRNRRATVCSITQFDSVKIRRKNPCAVSILSPLVGLTTKSLFRSVTEQ